MGIKSEAEEQLLEKFKDNPEMAKQVLYEIREVVETHKVSFEEAMTGKAVDDHLYEYEKIKRKNKFFAKLGLK